MGRLHHLRQTLPHNLKANARLPVQFVIVDYNSLDGLKGWIRSSFESEIKAGKLLYARTSEPRFFNMAHAKNIAHRLASGRIICNVDADNFVSAEFTRYLMRLFRESPRVVAHGVNIQSYWGRIAILKRWFEKLGGYDEDLGVRWGYEDSDFIARAKRLGLTELGLPKAFGESLPHSDVERLENFRADFNHRNESHAFNERLSRKNLERGCFVANGGTRWGRGRLEINQLPATRLRSQKSEGSDPYSERDHTLQTVMRELLRTVFDYERLGYDRRRMTFLATGLVGLGAARCETFWRLSRFRGRICLEIMSETALTCRLTQGKGCIWRGRWPDFEKMPIKLVPIRRPVRQAA
jgi:hypothetical protein